MPKALSALRLTGSLWVAVVLLLLLMVAMASATVFETTHGTELALFRFYLAPWFKGLLCLIAINMLAALLLRYPFNRKQVGFIMTHGGILLVFAGAAVTNWFSVNGEIDFPEGGMVSSFKVAHDTLKKVPLGFDLKLSKFRVGRYPGTERPRSFESHVTITDRDTGLSEDRIISMNNPTTYGGYTLYQSSYSQEEGISTSFLSVACDPGLPVVFAGYILTIIGMILTLVSRAKIRARTAGKDEVATITAATSPGIATILIIAVVTLFSAPSASAAGRLPTSLDLTRFRSIVVQRDGRWMPVDTEARDLVESITGTQFHQDRDPLIYLLAWSFDPKSWARAPLFTIANVNLRKELQLPKSMSVFSFAELVGHRHLLELLAQLNRRGEGKLNPLESKLKDIEKKLMTMQAALNGLTFKAIPGGDDINSPWKSITEVVQHAHKPGHEHGDEYNKAMALETAWAALGKSFLQDDKDAFTRATDQLKKVLDGMPAAHRPSLEQIEVELQYNRFEPFHYAWMIMAIGAVLSTMALLIRWKWLDALSLMALIAGFGALSYGLYLRWIIAGRIPASNMFESLLFLSWGMGAFGILAFFLFRHRAVPLTASAMGAVSLCLAVLLPIDHYIRPIPPVLLDTVWMSIHVPIIMVSYSVLTMAVLVAHAQVIVMAATPRKAELVKSIDTLLYWYMHAGSILLFIGITTGSMWAASSWGRYWGWDPKEVWSLVAFLAYMAILHIRLDHGRVPRLAFVTGLILAIGVFFLILHRMAPMGLTKVIVYGTVGGAVAFFAGARGAAADAVKNILAFWLIIMTYVGVNYVLGTGLHSYGFGKGLVADYVFMIGGIDLALVGGCYTVYRLRRARGGKFQAQPAV